MKEEVRRKKRIRNLVCVQYCALELLLAILAFELLGNALWHVHGAEAVPAIAGEIVQNSADMSKDSGLVVCIDAGHGGKDNGSDCRKHMEKNDNLELAKAVAAYLEGKGVTVVMTRADDTFLSLEERCAFANEKQADYFISLHRNDGNGNGVESWIHNEASEETHALAEKIMANLNTAGIQRNRGVKQGTQKSQSRNYYVNRYSDMPSCIVEMGFIGDAKDNQLFDEKLEAYAAAIGEAVLATYEEHKEAQGVGEMW